MLSYSYMRPLKNLRFRFRQRETQLLINKLRAGDSVLISGLRRIGKTWVIKEALSGIDPDEADIAYLDIEKFNDPADLIKAILDNMPKDMRERVKIGLEKVLDLPDEGLGWLKKHFASIEAGGVGIELTGAVRKDWRTLALRLEQIVTNQSSTGQSSTPYILALDEVPFFWRTFSTMIIR